MSDPILTKADGTVLYPFQKASKAKQSTGESPAMTGDSRLRVLTGADTTAVRAVAVLVAVLGVLGLVISFATVAEAARPAFGDLAWIVPVGIDVGIAVFSALGLVLARLDMGLPWLRLVPWSLVAAMIYLNVAGETTWFGRIAHAVLPGLWVVAVEVATHAVRVRAGLASGRRMDSIRFSRWVLAPLPTARLWRRMVLWEIRSYPDALGRERDRVLALTDLQDTYGSFAWRWKAPRRKRALYRLGELAPTSGRVAVAPPVPAAKPTTSKRRSKKKPAAPDVSDLLPAARDAHRRLDERGDSLTRTTLARELRAINGSAPRNDKLGALLDQLRTDTTAREVSPA